MALLKKYKILLLLIIATMMFSLMVGAYFSFSTQRMKGFFYSAKRAGYELVTRNFSVKLETEFLENKTFTINDIEYDVSFTIIYAWQKNDFRFSPNFFDTADNKLFFVNHGGTIAYMPLSDLEVANAHFTTIPSDIGSHFKSISASIKGMIIDDNRLFVSNVVPYKKEGALVEPCLRMQLLVADLNVEKIKFKKIFAQKTCDESIVLMSHERDTREKGQEKYFFDTNGVISETGGRIVSYKDNKILVSTGQYFGNPQKDDNAIGKIIAIDKDTGEYELIAKGFRNPQGLYYDAEEDIILSTDHGPRGGDEININVSPGGDVENYGWPIASYGKPYSLGDKENPFVSPHSAYGFVEPLKIYDMSIGISEIIKVDNKFNGINDKQIFLAALTGSDPDPQSGGLGVTHFILNDDYSTKQREVFELERRIRDLFYVESINKIIAYSGDDQTIIVISPK